MSNKNPKNQFKKGNTFGALTKLSPEAKFFRENGRTVLSELCVKYLYMTPAELLVLQGDHKLNAMQKLLIGAILKSIARDDVNLFLTLLEQCVGRLPVTNNQVITNPDGKLQPVVNIVLPDNGYAIKSDEK